MLHLILPTAAHREDVLAFYREIEEAGGACIGFANRNNYNLWLRDMQNRHNGRNLPAGYVRENFYLCYEGENLIGVFSLKFELTEYLLHYGGHIGYAVRPTQRNRGLATQILAQGKTMARQLGMDRLLCVCNEDNLASEKVILNNGGILENKEYDPEEGVFVNRYWIRL